MQLNCLLVRLEDFHVHEFVLLRCLEMHAVLGTKLLLQRREPWVNQDLLNGAYHLVEAVVVIISTSANKFKIFVVTAINNHSISCVG